MTHRTWIVLATLNLAIAGCPEDGPNEAPAPKTSTLTDSKPKARGAAEFAIREDDAKVMFMMDAPNEKIRGNLAKATTGTLAVPLDDVTKTTGHLYVDLGKLVVGQQKPNDKGEFSGEWQENPLQNEHAKEWLQVACVNVPADKQAECEAAATKNKNVEFVITKVETDQKDITKLTGDSRTIKATVTGTFLLHQVAKERSAKVEITFAMNGDEPGSVSIKTVEPMAVKLGEHEVGPNDVFGKFAKNTLQTLDAFINETKKVAEAAEITFEFTAMFSGMAKTAPSASPSAANPSDK